jgi:hypothetical protein
MDVCVARRSKMCVEGLEVLRETQILVKEDNGAHK